MYAHPYVVTVTVDYINSVQSVNTQKQSVKFGQQMLKLNFSTSLNIRRNINKRGWEIFFPGIHSSDISE